LTAHQQSSSLPRSFAEGATLEQYHGSGIKLSNKREKVVNKTIDNEYIWD